MISSICNIGLANGTALTSTKRNPLHTRPVLWILIEVETSLSSYLRSMKHNIFWYRGLKCSNGFPWSADLCGMTDKTISPRLQNSVSSNFSNKCLTEQLIVVVTGEKLRFDPFNTCQQQRTCTPQTYFVGIK